MSHLTISDHTENLSNKGCGRKKKIKTTLNFPKEITLEEKVSVTKVDTITTDDKKLVTVEV